MDDMTADTEGSTEDRTDSRTAGEAGRCVVGFDGSGAARTALDWAVSRALRNGRDVHLVGVVDDDAGAMGIGYAEQSALQHAHLLSDTAAQLVSAHPELVVTTQLVHGAVAAALAETTRADDTVIIGSDKTGYARGRLYGARSIQLAALVPAPLVVIPAADLRLRDGIVVALDGTEASDSLARLGAREAVARDCRLSLIHAVPPGAADEQRRRGYDALGRALEKARTVGPALEVTRHVTSRRPAEAVLNLARDRALLLVGRSRRTPSPGLGGTLHEVLINANVPVMVVP